MSVQPLLFSFVALGLAFGLGCSDSSDPKGSDTTDTAVDTSDTLSDTTPDTADTPDTTDMPDTPDTPDTSDTPDTPDTPDTSDTPDTPDTPDTSDTPDTPDTPDTTPDTPDTPDTVDTSPETDTSDTLSDPSRTVVGKTLAEWGASWWRWHYGLDARRHPAIDTTGSICGVGQGGSVFFLPGTFEANSNRTCRVPVGKHIFIPIVATAYDNAGVPEDQHVSPAILQSEVDDYIESVTALELRVNSETWTLSDLDPYRVPATSFEYELPAENNLLEYLGYLPDAGRVESFHGGYYVMLDPLPVGSHSLFIRSQGADGTFEDRFTLVVYEPTPNYEILPPMRDPSALTAGKSLAQWAVAWVQWYYSIPWSVHPAREFTSAHCVQNQTPEVTFLGGGSLYTECTVPAGKPIVMPILFSVVETCGDSAADISAMTIASEERTRAIADAGDNLMVQLDSDIIFFAEFSLEAGDFRVGLQTFPIEIPASDSLLAGRDGNPFTGVCDPTWMDGHFVVIAPLAPGTYNLSTSSIVTLPHHIGAEPRQVDTLYRLTVAD